MLRREAIGRIFGGVAVGGSVVDWFGRMLFGKPEAETTSTNYHRSYPDDERSPLDDRVEQFEEDLARAWLRKQGFEIRAGHVITAITTEVNGWKCHQFRSGPAAKTTKYAGLIQTPGPSPL